MSSSKKQTLYGSIFYAVVTLALPTMLEQIMSVFMQYVDTAMVGHLGAEATASVSTSTSITWLIGAVPSAFGVAAMTLIAQAIGAKEEKKVAEIGRHALIFGIAVGAIVELICFSVCPHVAEWMGAAEAIRPDATRYFFWISVPVGLRVIHIILASAIRATRDTKTPMYIGIGANALNVVLNYLLIYKAGFGVAGAAYASCISTVIGFIAMFIAFIRNPYFDFSDCGKNVDWSMIKRIWALSYPLLIINVASCSGYVVFAGLVSHMGTIIFAAHSIAVGAEELFYIGGYGFKSAANTLVGISYGENNREKYHEVCVSSVVCTLTVMTISGILLYIFATPLMGFFTTDPEVIALGSSVLKMVAFSEPFFGLYVISEGIYYGLGMTKYPLVIEFCGMWLVRILSTYICINFFHGDLTAVWWCMIADNVTKAILLSIPLGKLWSIKMKH